MRAAAILPQEPVVWSRKSFMFFKFYMVAYTGSHFYATDGGAAIPSQAVRMEA